MDQKILPMFPLQLVVLQGEVVPLHIFEPRYKALVAECYAQNATFGIPSLVEGKPLHSGAEMKIVSIKNTYSGGEMDILCMAEQRFEIVEYFQSNAAANTSHALIQPLDFTNNEDKELNVRLFDLLHEFYAMAKVEVPDSLKKAMSIPEIFHKCGLSYDQELELAEFNNTSARQIFIVEHLKKLLPVLDELDRMRKAIHLNGHFKKLPQSF